jgi:lysozyme family protein
LCIFRRSSLDFVHYLKSIMKSCTFSEDPPQNPTTYSQIYTIPRGTSKNAQNPRKNFQICTKSHRDLPKMHKIPWILVGFCAYLEVSRGILCNLRSSSLDFVHLCKFLMGFC